MSEDKVARYLTGLRGGTVSRTEGPAIRKAKAQAVRLLSLAMDLRFDELTKLISDAPIDASGVALLVYVAAQRGASERQSRAASAKNKEARNYVKSQWAKRQDLKEGKAAFARRFAEVVRKKFGATVTARTIARDWLANLPAEDAWSGRDAIAWTGSYHKNKME